MPIRVADLAERKIPLDFLEVLTVGGQPQFGIL